MKDQNFADVQPSVKRRHEWLSFLGLQPVLDLSGVDPILYHRCLKAVWRLPGQAVVHRSDFLAGSSPNLPGSLDRILARLVRDEILVPILTEPFSFHVRSERWANPESVYAGDDRAALIEITRTEQMKRLGTLRELNKCLELARLPERSLARIRREQENLQRIYDATWLELGDAIGAADCERIGDELEGDSTALSAQLGLCFEEAQEFSQEGERECRK